jgi:osmotically-inducible protein OsmY
MDSEAPQADVVIWKGVGGAVFAMQETIANGLDATNAERAARRRLENCGYEALKHIACNFRRGKMILQGTVPRYYHKQIAQEAVRDLRHVDIVVNDIHVSPR